MVNMILLIIIVNGFLSGTMSKAHCSKLIQLSSTSFSCYEGHNGPVFNVVWSPNGNRLASAGADGKVQVWDAKSKQQFFTLQHKGSVRSIAWSHNGKYIASASDDGAAKIWNATTGNLIYTYNNIFPVYCITFSYDDTEVATANEDGTVRVWDALTGNNLRIYKVHHAATWFVAWAPGTSNILASGGDDGIVQILDTRKGRPITTYYPTGEVYGLTWAPRGGQLASVNVDGSVDIWATNLPSETDPTLTINNTCDGAPVYGLAWSRVNPSLAVGCGNKTVKIWNINTGQLFKQCQGHEGAVYGVAWSPDGMFLAAGSGDETVITWAVSTCVKL